MRFSLFLALKYLRPKRGVASVVTILSILGVTIGVAIVIIVQAVFTGFGDTWQSKILDFKPHLVVRSMSGGALSETETLCKQIEALPSVKACAPSIETRVLVEHNNRILAPVLLGTDETRIQKMFPLVMKQGAFDLSYDGIVIGEDMATMLQVSIGDELEVYSPMNVVSEDEAYLPERLPVTGIFSSGQLEFDRDYLFASLPVARDLTGLDKEAANGLNIKIDNPHALRPPVGNEPSVGIVNEIEQLALKFYGTDLKGQPQTKVSTWQEMDQMIFNAVATEKNMMTLLLMFICVVAIFCVVNTIIVITVQKTNEVGLLKALGFSTFKLTMIFVLYGWIQCLIGTTLGIGLAFLVLFNLQNLVDFLAYLGMDVFPKAIYGLDALPWRIVPGEIAFIAVMVVLLCVLASLLPAWRAAAMNPVDALRKE
jgi:lipoprotein-releasing system permease protein